MVVRPPSRRVVFADVSAPVRRIIIDRGTRVATRCLRGLPAIPGPDPRGRIVHDHGPANLPPRFTYLARAHCDDEREALVEPPPARSRSTSASSNEVMRSAFSRAQIVADTLCSDWNNLYAKDAKAMLSEVRSIDSEISELFCGTHAIREPVAAGATQFRDYIEGQGPEEVKVGRLMLVIDAGAGTTDFALFQSFYDPSNDEASFALISKAVGMSRVAGNRFDMVLRPLILRACRIHPENGSPWSEEDFSIIKADLSAQIRSLKQQLFNTGNISISLRPGASGLMSLSDLESEVSYQELGRNLVEQRSTILRKAFTEEQLGAFKTMNDHLGRPIPIFVLLTGGSSRLPPIRALAEGRLNRQFRRFKPADSSCRHHGRHYRP